MTAPLLRKASATSCEGRVIDPSSKWAQAAAHGSDYPGGQQQIPLFVVIVVLGIWTRKTGTCIIVYVFL